MYNDQAKLGQQSEESVASRNAVLTIGWAAGALLILAIPQTTLYVKIVGLQLYSVAFILIIRSYKELYCNWFYKLLVTLAFSLALIFMVLFLRKVLQIADLTSIILSIGTSITVLLIPGATAVILLKFIWDMKVRFLEIFPLSFILSLLVASIVALLLRERLQLVLFYLVTTLLLLILLVYIILQRKIQVRISSGIFNEDLLNIILIGLGAIMVIFTLYPNETFIPYYDISRHYASAISFATNPNRIRGPYPAFWGHIAIIYELSGNLNPFILNTILEFWTLMLLVTLYVFVRRCYSSLHASVATYLYLFGAGLGWIYILKLISEGKVWIENMGHIFLATNADIGYGLGTWIWFWYRPVVIGTLSLFLLMYSLLYKNIDNKVRWLILLSVPAVLMNYHPSEVILSLVLIFGVAIVKKLDFNVVILFTASIIVGVAIRLIYTPYNLQQTLLFSSMSITAVFLSYPLSIYIRRISSILLRTKISNFMSKISNAVYVTIIVSFILTILYCYTLSIESFAISLDILPVPLYHYVILLGVPGILAFISFLGINHVKGSDRDTNKILVSVMLLAFLVGKTITYVNESPLAGLITSLMGSSYFERRIVASLVYPIICILASRFFDIIKTICIKK